MPFFYKEMLNIRAPFNPTDDKLDCLARHMADNVNNDFSTIPAGYTYLSQFIDHDISLDPLSRIFPWEMTTTPTTLHNKRTPFFDLETLYGTDDKRSFTAIDRSDLLETNSFLKIGSTVPDGIPISRPNDLPRHLNCVKALLVDGRNDENLGLAQTHVAFIRFHNAIVKHLNEGDTTAVFKKARRMTIRHYQWIILHDFLPKIVKKDVLDDVIKNRNKFYKPTDNDVFIPLEFSVGAYRTGHSMIRNLYNWNKIFKEQAPSNGASIGDLIKFTGSSCEKKFNCMEGKLRLPSDWIINWNWFYNINDSMKQEHFNFAAPINTLISSGLGKLAPVIVSEFHRLFSLPAFDLYRARAMGLPTGQAIAKRIASETNAKVLQPEQIAPLLPEELKKEFSVETPLWFYLLAEAQLNTNGEGKYGEILGDVGSWIVAETIVELLRRSEYSIFEIDFPNHPDFLGQKPNTSNNNNDLDNQVKFGMPEMLWFVESKEPGFLNPLE